MTCHSSLDGPLDVFPMKQVLRVSSVHGQCNIAVSREGNIN